MNLLRTLKIKESLLKKPNPIKSFLISVILVSCFFSCRNNSNNLGDSFINIKNGNWVVHLNLNGETLPVSLEIQEQNDGLEFIFKNGEERIEVNKINESSDSLWFDLPVFESSFHLKKLDSVTLKGYWVNYYKSADYKISASAFYGNVRFRNQTIASNKNLNSNYEVSFSPNSEDEYKAIGMFETIDEKAFGTFATETGDYRFLEGNVYGDSLFLSTFDGSHAFLFKARINGDSLSGVFYSGIHFKEPWIAIKNDSFLLRDPDSLTNSNSKTLTLKLPDHNDSLVDINSDFFDSKVKLIQIMGSWCPNCLDESLYYTDLYETYKNKGLEIIAVAFERTKNKEKALYNLNRLKERTSANYTFLLGGSTREENPLVVFPTLNHVMSYPTTIYLNRHNEVVKIHTGFYGPSTGVLFEEYKKDTENFIDSLLLD